MKVKKIEIENYRGFKKLDITFNESINVFVGINGAGKSSIIDLLAAFLNNFTVKFSGASVRELEHKLTMLDINIEEQETINKITVSPDANFEYNFDTYGKSHLLSWELKRDFNGGKNNFKEINSYIDEYRKIFKVNPDQSIPILKYFQSQRNSTEKQKYSNSKKRYLAEQFKAYEDAFDKTLEFDEFISWFVEEENKENRIKVNSNDLSYKNPKLNAIRNAITLFLKSFPSITYDNLRVEERPFNVKTSEKSSLVIDKDKQTFNLKQLSDGEKVLILMVADIAHRLALANPGKNNCLEGSGIILIDEIDLHLHPAWQRDVIPCLKTTFPNIQLITTTHSPQVLSNIERANAYIIEDFKIVEETPYTYGNDSNTILEDLFNVNERPNHTKEKIEKLYDLIEENNDKAAVKLLDELKKQLGNENHELLRAIIHYDFQKTNNE